MRGGLRLCALDDLEATGAKGLTLGRPPHTREIVLVRSAGGVCAYANRCPHLYSTLETFPDRFLDESGAFLVCSTHGARFRVSDGYCVQGPCAGDSLEPVAIAVVGGSVLLAE